MAQSKLVSMQEAITECLDDSMTIIIEGFTHLICHAAGHEIIRQGVSDLTLARMTPDLVYDQLIEAGCAKKLVFSWAGNPGVGSLHAIRRRTEVKNGPPRLELEEYSHGGMMARLQAGSQGLPFGVINSFQGSDIPTANPKISEIKCPYTGKSFATVPALNPDLCIVHCQRADTQGNAQVWGLMGTQKESAFASKKVIVVAEEIVSTKMIRSDPNRTIIPEVIVSHVVHEPWGAHPSFAQGYYDRDNDFYVAWDELSRDSKTYRDWLEAFVLETKDHKGYMKKLGMKTKTRLKARPKICKGVDYGY